MHNLRRVAIAATLLCTTPALAGPPAVIDDKMRLTLARVASVNFAIQEYCSKYYQINEKNIHDFAGAASATIFKSDADGSGAEVLKKEFARRGAEVEATGPELWCKQQRDVQNRIGTGTFMN